MLLKSYVERECGRGERLLRSRLQDQYVLILPSEVCPYFSSVLSGLLVCHTFEEDGDGKSVSCQVHSGMRPSTRLGPDATNRPYNTS